MSSALTSDLPTALSNSKKLFAQVETSFNPSPAFIDLGGANVIPLIGAEEINWAPDRERLARNVQLADIGRMPGVTGVQKGTKLTFKLPATGLGPCGDGVDTSTMNTPLTSILAACGFDRADQKGTKLTGPSTAGADSSSLPVADASMLFEGHPVVVLDPDGFAHMVIVKTNAKQGADEPTAGTIEVVPKLPFTLATNSVVYAAVRFKRTLKGPTASFICIGDGYADRLRGCAGAITKIEVNAQQRVMIEFSFEVAAFDPGVVGDNGAISFKGATVQNLDAMQSAVTGFVSHDVVVERSPFHWGIDAIDTTPIASATLEPGFKITPKVTTEAENAIGGWHVTEVVPMLSLQPYLDAGWETEFNNAVIRTAIVQAGAVPGQGFGIIMGGAQVDKYPGKTDKDGAVAMDVKLLGTALGPDYLGGSPIYLAFW